jgi:hypothetical protein
MPARQCASFLDNDADYPPSLRPGQRRDHAIALSAATTLAHAQATDAPAVAAAKAAIAGDIASSLPYVPLDAWLRDLAGSNAMVTWAAGANDCGEQTGNPALDRGRDFPLCADVRLALTSGRTLSLSFLVGTMPKGVNGKPALFGGQFSEPNRPAIIVSDLALVPTFVSEAARLRQARAWAADLRPGMTRADVERRLDHPTRDGGIIAIDGTRYYLGFDVKIEVPYARAQLTATNASTDRVSGPAVVSRGAYAMD